MTSENFSAKLNEIRHYFQKNISSVNDLLTFDETIQLVCTQALKKMGRKPGTVTY